VLNTTSYIKKGWANSIPISFFRQFEYACKNFAPDNEYMLFITADVKSENWEDFFVDADRVLKLENVGTYSPTLSYNTYQLGWHPSLFFEIETFLAIVYHNDLVLTYIHKNLIKELNSFFEYFNSRADTFNPTVGWGIDHFIRLMTQHLGTFNLRNRSHNFIHPSGRSYDIEAATMEMKTILMFIDDYCKEFEIELAGTIEEQIYQLVKTTSFLKLAKQIKQFPS
jgi:hypothetical protein